MTRREVTSGFLATAALAAGTTAAIAHRAMRQFQLAIDRIGDLMAYLKSLEP